MQEDLSAVSEKVRVNGNVPSARAVIVRRLRLQDRKKDNAERIIDGVENEALCKGRLVVVGTEVEVDAGG